MKISSSDRRIGDDLSLFRPDQRP